MVTSQDSSEPSAHFDRSEYWKRHIREGNRAGNLGLLQTEGWGLLCAYLNAGLGRAWWAYPFFLGISDHLVGWSNRLSDWWEEYSKAYAGTRIKGSPRHQGVEGAISHHFLSLEGEIGEFGTAKRKVVTAVPEESDWPRPLRKMIAKTERLGPYLSSYWIHGSFGSGDAKPYWSDVDGLAILKTSTVTSPEKMRAVRRKLIGFRANMVDVMAYQLHGHFFLTEIDILNCPEPMFPAVLFKHATCVMSQYDQHVICQRQDRRLSREMLWIHGVADLLKEGKKIDTDTTRKVQFLHRSYLLPCLVSQCYGRPLFKSEVFEKLESFFTREEAEVLRDISSVWKDWRSPRVLSRIILSMSAIVRFNPLLYQKTSHFLGRKVNWFPGEYQEKWGEWEAKMLRIAKNVWNRVPKDDSYTQI